MGNYLMATLAFLASALLFAGCISTLEGSLSQYAAPPTRLPSQPSSTAAPRAQDSTELANPSAAYCIEEGYEYEIRKNPDGSEDGACVFPNGKECEGWAYYRGECDENGAAGGQLANEGGACGGAAGTICEGGPECMAEPANENAPAAACSPAPGFPGKPDDTFFICPEARPDKCTEEYNPVCGQAVQVGSVVYFKNYGNECMACSKGSNAVGYLMGTCNSHGK